MNIKNTKIGLVGIALSLLAAGCANKGAKNEYSMANNDSQTYMANTHGVGEMDAFDGRNLTAHERELLAQRKFLFDFDRDSIKSNDYESLHAHAEYLRENPNKVIRVEGHTDEQGSREYNIGLGERRGRAIATYLMSNGVSPNQIHVVSYGAEKPEVMATTDAAYRANRRAMIVYEQ